MSGMELRGTSKSKVSLGKRTFQESEKPKDSTSNKYMTSLRKKGDKLELNEQELELLNLINGDSPQNSDAAKSETGGSNTPINNDKNLKKSRRTKNPYYDDFIYDDNISQTTPDAKPPVAAVPAAKKSTKLGNGKKPGTSASHSRAPQQVQYCICKSSDDNRQMIMCDKCEGWYHFDCVGINENMVESFENYEFICPLCYANSTNGSKNGGNRNKKNYHKTEISTSLSNNGDKKKKNKRERSIGNEEDKNSYIDSKASGQGSNSNEHPVNLLLTAIADCSTKGGRVGPDRSSKTREHHKRDDVGEMLKAEISRIHKMTVAKEYKVKEVRRKDGYVFLIPQHADSSHSPIKLRVEKRDFSEEFSDGKLKRLETLLGAFDDSEETDREEQKIDCYEKLKMKIRERLRTKPSICL